MVCHVTLWESLKDDWREFCDWLSGKPIPEPPPRPPYFPTFAKAFRWVGKALTRVTANFWKWVQYELYPWQWTAPGAAPARADEAEELPKSPSRRRVWLQPREILLAGMLLAVSIGLFPPYQFVTHGGTMYFGSTTSRFAGYALLFDPPTARTESGTPLENVETRLDTGRLEVEWVTLLLVVTGLLLRSKQASVARGEHEGGAKRSTGNTAAKRFAKLLVSEIDLYNRAVVAEGRKNKDLYRRLKAAIDRSRQTYEERFGKILAKRYDYLHEELVRTLASNDASLLGADYPGPVGSPDPVDMPLFPEVDRLRKESDQQLPQEETPGRLPEVMPTKVDSAPSSGAPRPLWIKIFDDLRGPSLDNLEESLPKRADGMPVLFFNPVDNLPLWFPREWNGRSLTQQKRQRWFEELLTRFSPGWNEWTPDIDPTEWKEDLANTVYSILCDLDNGILSNPSFMPDSSS